MFAAALDEPKRTPQARLTSPTASPVPQATRGRAVDPQGAV